MSNIVPIHALPEEILNKQIFDLGDWMQGVLSLRGEESMKRLEILLPQIKKTAKGISIREIKTAFDLYLDNKLTIEPRDNYLTLILFNKVIKEYKDRLPKKTKVIQEMSEEEKHKLNEEAYKRAKAKYLETGEMDGAVSIYNWLDSQNKLQGERSLQEWNDYKREVFKRLKPILKDVYQKTKVVSREEKTEIKHKIKSLETNKNSELIVLCKTEILKTVYNEQR